MKCIIINQVASKMNTSISIYIPRMSMKHTEEDVRIILEGFYIGNVSRIDFTPINKKPGFGENIDSVVKSAFIHFSHTPFLSNELFPNSSIVHLSEKFWNEIRNGMPYKLQATLTEFWICLKNKSPVKRTLMNIHQIVENGRYVENLVQEQANKIAEQAVAIEKLSDKLNRIYQVIDQILPADNEIQDNSLYERKREKLFEYEEKETSHYKIIKRLAEEKAKIHAELYE